MVLILALIGAWLFSLSTAQNETCKAVTQQLTELPYSNYFYSDCNVDAQAVVTSPLPDSNLTIIGPRLIIAWPAGNSGICTFFQPTNGRNGSLGIELVNSTVGSPLGAVYQPSASTETPFVGVQGVLSFNSSATLNLAILGSVRTIRDFTEGPSKLTSYVQDAVQLSRFNDTGIVLTRLWLDNITSSNFRMFPYHNSSSRIGINSTSKTVLLEAGQYLFSASFNYPQLKQLAPPQVLNNESQALITQEPSGTTSLSFLSYSNKLLAGAWRFLTYFGRDSMIAALLLEPVLSTGNGSATEAVIAAVLERINRTDGSVSHEETIGDYATLLNKEKNITSTAAGQTYPMIDTDFYLPIIMARYFSTHPRRIQPLLSREAGFEDDPSNRNLTYGNLSLIAAQKIMNSTAAFAQSQTIANLIHLKSSEVVGQWRDSQFGIGGGRIPFDVNTALVPAALHAISTLASIPGIYPNTTPYSNWSTIASSRAKIWEDSTLQFFTTSVSASTARDRLDSYIDSPNNTFYSGPSNSDTLPTPDDANITSYAISLNGNNNLSLVNVLHSDTSFRLFFTNTTNDTQLTSFLNNTADSLNRPFPAGLLTDVGMVIANPALSGSNILIANFTNSAYHGTVVWSWTLAMMAKGLERQLARCNLTSTKPAFCTDTPVHSNVVAAYNNLWDVIEENSESLESEVWSWQYVNGTGYVKTPLGALPPPPGSGPPTESDIRQLWSLVFLAVKRNVGVK